MGTAKMKKINFDVKNRGDSGDTSKKWGWVHCWVHSSGPTFRPYIIEESGKKGGWVHFLKSVYGLQKKNFSELKKKRFLIRGKNGGDSGPSGPTPKNLAISPSGGSTAGSTLFYAMGPGFFYTMFKLLKRWQHE